jgi:hypothetical protein
MSYRTITVNSEVHLTLAELSEALRLFPKDERREFLLKEVYAFIDEYEDEVIVHALKVGLR